MKIIQTSFIEEEKIIGNISKPSKTAIKMQETKCDRCGKYSNNIIKYNSEQKMCIFCFSDLMAKDRQLHCD